MDLVFAYVTASSPDEARRIGRALVEERLAACVNILPGMISIYRWQGAVETAEETVLIAKTRADLFEALSARVKELHSYEVPCVVELRLGRGNPDYLGWLETETG
ncbi:divalent-cation tolerance protein CutA [Azospirillum sp. TSO22-1]|uniref:divalent-cation tolerance protein CutA n=1 Tax=Azospirillum sp. TSO22-1 TaxID=716789 RepID=UPI000D617347|nr:divalent-cation tolerance protein CutA [Azospirillum sp. TSO22-1]PWC32178.1 dihydroorotate dehydrogenase [Azospirillum sp. TSO22-1]